MDKSRVVFVYYAFFHMFISFFLHKDPAEVIRSS